MSVISKKPLITGEEKGRHFIVSRKSESCRFGKCAVCGNSMQVNESVMVKRRK